MAHVATTTTNLNDLFRHQLDTLYGVERQGRSALTRMARAATSPALRKELESAADETSAHVKRLDEVYAAIGSEAGTSTSKCIEGLFEDCAATAGLEADPGVRDAAMVAMAQAVQDNEIGRYRTAHAWATSLKQDKAGSLIKQILDEETAASRRLKELATGLNQEAAQRVDV